MPIVFISAPKLKPVRQVHLMGDIREAIARVDGLNLTPEQVTVRILEHDHYIGQYSDAIAQITIYQRDGRRVEDFKEMSQNVVDVLVRHFPHSLCEAIPHIVDALVCHIHTRTVPEP